MSEDVSAGRLLLEVVADTAGLRADLKAKLDALSRDLKAQVRAQLVIDAEQARAEIKAATRDQVVKVTVRADTAAAKADLDKASADRTVTIKAKADTTAARADLDAVSRDRTAKIKTEADKSSLQKTIADIGEKMTSIAIPTFIGSGIVAAVGAAGQLAGSLVAVAAAGSQAVGVIGALPGLLLAAAQAGGAVKLGFSGITAAVSAYSARQVSAGADAIASAQQVRAAQDQVRTSAQALLNAQIGGAQQAAQAQHAYQQAVTAVADAQYNAAQSVGNSLHAEQQAAIAVSDARYNAVQSVTSSEHSYTDSLFAERQAQIALSQARIDARQNLVQTGFALRGAVLGEKQAALSLAEARIKLQNTNQSAAATPQQRAQALLDYQQAQLQQAEAVNTAQQAAAAKKKADKLGVSGSQQVVQARHAEADAIFSLHTAEQAVTRARLEATRSVKEAEYQLQQSVQAYARAQVVAVRSVIAAQYQEAQAAQTIANDRRTSAQQLLNAQISYSEALLAAKSPLLGVSSAQTALNKAMGLLTPAGRALVQFIDSTLIPKYKDLQKATANALLPGVTAGLKSALPVIGTIRGGLKGTAGVLGGVASRFGAFLGSASVRSDLSSVMAVNNKAIGTFGDAALHVVDAIRNIAVAAEPLVKKISDFVDNVAKKADSLSGSGRKSGGLAKFFDDAWKSAVQLGKIAGNLLLTVGHLFGAAAPSGSSLLGSLVLATKKLADFTGSSGGQAKLAKFFRDTVPVAREFGDLLVKAAGIIIKIVASFGGGQLNGVFTVLNLALTILSTLTKLPGFGNVVQWVLLLSTAGAGLGLVASKIGAIGKGLGVLSKFTGLDALAKKLGLGDTVGGAVGGGFGKLGGKILGSKALPARIAVNGAGEAEQLAATGATGLRGAAASAGGWLSGVFSAAGTAAGNMAGKIGTALSATKTALASGVTAASGWASSFASSMGSAIASGARFVAGLGRQLVAGARSLIVFVGEQAAAAAAFIAENLAMAAAATAAFIAENLATLGIIAGLALLVGAIVYTATHWSQVWGLIKKYAKDAWDFIYNGIGKYLLVLLGPAGLIILGIIEVSKHWSSIWGTITSVADDAFKFIKRGASDLVSGLGKIWGGLEKIFKTPVNFLIGTVYDNGIRKFWNKVVGAVGLGTLDLPEIKPLASGGMIPGYAPGHDTVPAMLSPGEAVLTPGAARAIGGARTVNALNAAHQPGRGTGKSGHYAGGGIVGGIINGIESAVSGAVDVAKAVTALATGNVTAFGNALKPLIGTTASGALGKMMIALPEKLITTAAKSVLSLFSSAGGGMSTGPAGGRGAVLGGPSLAVGGGLAPQVAGWFAQAVKLTGVPTSWIPALEVIGQHESSDNPTAINLCITLDAMILTKRGWLKHDEVQLDDETIGYNFATGQNEWTRITAVHHYRDAPLVRIGNSRWHATVTPEHRWVSMPREHVLQAAKPDRCPECGYAPAELAVQVAKLRADEHLSFMAIAGRLGLSGAPAARNLLARGAGAAGGNAVAVHRSKAHGLRGAQSENRPAGSARFVMTRDLNTRDRIILAAVADTGPGINITEQEAAMLGWIAGDGHVEKYVNKPRGRKKPSMSIAQSKPAMVEKLTVLLEGVPCAHYTEDPRLSRVNKKLMSPRHQWRLDYRYAEDLMSRVGHPKKDAVRQVLAMSATQRRAWLDAFIDAEGHRDGGYVSVTQAHGPVLDAAHLAIYLCGYRPRRVEIARTNEAWSPTAYISAGRPVIAGSFLKKEGAGRGPVWCVATELGSWTAEQDGQIFLTGNSDSNAAAGTPSKGIMQTIDPTFSAFHQAGTSWNIYNPIANIAAAINYILSRYGNIANVPGIRSLAAGGPYVGYDTGGPLKQGVTHVVNATGRDEAVLNPGAIDLLGGYRRVSDLNQAGRLYRTGSVTAASATAEVRTPVLAGATINVYPQPGQSEEHIGQVAARKIGLMLA